MHTQQTNKSQGHLMWGSRKIGSPVTAMTRMPRGRFVASFVAMAWLTRLPTRMCARRGQHHPMLGKHAVRGQHVLGEVSSYMSWPFLQFLLRLPVRRTDDLKMDFDREWRNWEGSRESIGSFIVRKTIQFWKTTTYLISKEYRSKKS